MDCQVIIFPIEEIIEAVNTFFELEIDENVETCGYIIKVTKPMYEGLYIPFTLYDKDIEKLEENNIKFIKLRSLLPGEFYYIN